MKYYDYYTGDSENTIFTTSKDYEEGSLNLQKTNLTTSVSTTITSYTELGNNTILLQEPVLKDERLMIEYTVANTITVETTEEYSIKKRLTDLEEAVKLLHENNLALQEALNNRLAISTFQAWSNLVEKKTGINLVEGKLGHISQELYK